MYHQKVKEYLLKILKALEGNNSVVLVGGQCLVVWASYYESLGHQNLHVATEDIDLIGDKEVVQKLEQLLNTRASIPGFGDATPEVGVLRVPINAEQKITIDVLSNIAGLSKSEIEKYSATLTFGGFNVRLLNPVGMLKSRIANVALLRRTSDHSLSQLKATVKIVNFFIKFLLDNGYRFARKEISDVLQIAEQRDGIQLYTEHNIDILDALPKSHAAYPAEFLSKHLPSCIDRIERKRTSRA